MNRRLIKIVTLVLTLGLLLSTIGVMADTGYTYNYDFWEEVQYSPDAYAVKATLTSEELKLEKRIKNASGLFVKDNLIYLCDSGNNRIIVIEYDGASYNVVRIIEDFTGDTEILTFKNPTDIFVDDEGTMYICDRDNQRVVKLTKDLEYIMSFVQPDDELFDSNISFLPYRLIVDDAGRVYLVANHVNKGLIKYEPDGSFTGFVGATPVTYSWYKYIWKNYFMTKAQRAQTQDFVPTEYDNISVDKDGFIYVCTTHIDDADLQNDQGTPIRRLNSLGNDILIKNGNFNPIGDIQWSDDAGYTGASKLVDVTPLENDTYFAFDMTRGRIFGYDSQGHLLYAFGGNGNRDGYFRKPEALDHMGYDLLALDSIDGQITVFTPTEYGKLIFNALELYTIGDYEGSALKWKEALVLNNNYELAYIGIGRAALRKGDYKEAMDYFKVKLDDDNYAKAFKLYRKQWVEDHVLLIMGIFIVIVVLPLLIGRFKKIKMEVAKYESEAKYRRK